MCVCVIVLGPLQNAEKALCVWFKRQSGKNKTLQMVTLQVKIELFFFVLGNFSARGKQEHGRELCADFLWLCARVQFSLAVLPFEVFYFGPRQL